MLGEAMSILARSERGAVGELAGLHAREQVAGSPPPLRSRNGLFPARFGQRAAVGAHLFGRQVADEGLAVLDQLMRAQVA